MIFGFGKKKKAEIARLQKKVAELLSEREGLEVELQDLSEKLDGGLEERPGDRSTTLSRYPKRIVELKIGIDEIDRKLKAIQARMN